MEFGNLKVYENIYEKCDHSVESILNMLIRVNTYNKKIKNGGEKDGSEIRESKR